MRPRLVLVTDPAYEDVHVDRVVAAAARAVAPGAFAVQLRDRAAPAAALLARARLLRAVTRDAGALLVVNGDARVARDAEADGVHLGGAWCVQNARDVAGDAMWISVAAHDDADVERAASEGADAVLVSPIFATPGPHKAPPRGLVALERAAQLVDADAHALDRAALDRAALGREAHDRDARGTRRDDGARHPRRALQLIALGGVTHENARSCRDAGASGAAVIRALLSSDRPSDVARAIDCAFAPLC